MNNRLRSVPMLHTAVHSSTPLAFKRYHGLLNGANQSPADGLLAWERVLRVHAQADETALPVFAKTDRGNSLDDDELTGLAAQFAELLKTVRANRDDDLEIAAGMECVLKWRAVVALTPEERALAMAAAPSVDGASPAEAIEDFVRRNSTLDFDDIRAMPRPLRRHLLDSRVKELATYADEDKIAETNQRMVEAAAFAVEKCLKQTKGQVCYICLDDESMEGLVRGCACRGGNGFAHVSCLARQAHLHFGDNLAKGMQSTENDNVFVRWNNCRLCDQSFYGPVGTCVEINP